MLVNVIVTFLQKKIDYEFFWHGYDYSTIKILEHYNVRILNLELVPEIRFKLSPIHSRTPSPSLASLTQPGPRDERTCWVLKPIRVPPCA